MNSRPYDKFNQLRLNYNFSQNYNEPPQHNYNLRPSQPKKWQGGSPYCQKNSGNSGVVKCLGCGTVE